MAFQVVELVREKRGESAYWVHMHGTGNFTSAEQKTMDRELSAEARKWARELGMQSSDWISGGGEYGEPWRHSLCFSFKAA